MHINRYVFLGNNYMTGISSCKNQSCCQRKKFCHIILTMYKPFYIVNLYSRSISIFQEKKNIAHIWILSRKYKRCGYKKSRRLNLLALEIRCWSAFCHWSQVTMCATKHCRRNLPTLRAVLYTYIQLSRKTFQPAETELGTWKILSSQIETACIALYQNEFRRFTIYATYITPR